MEMLTRWHVLAARCWLTTSEIGVFLVLMQSKKFATWLAIGR
jgi:hypothetical protein